MKPVIIITIAFVLLIPISVFAEEPEQKVCTAQYDPVCGISGETFSNRCELESAGGIFDYEGECVGSEPELKRKILCGDGTIDIDGICQVEPIEEEQKIPEWIKNNAKWWSEGQITQDDFIQGTQYMIQQGLLEVPPSDSTQEDSSNVVPEWVKNNAGWWADGLISDTEFVSSLQFLIENKILVVIHTKSDDGYGLNGEIKHPQTTNLPECSEQILTVTPVDLNYVYYITPLGNLGPPEHTLPTEHMYIHLTSEGVDLRAPADLRLISMSRTIYQETGTQDYSLEFSFCNDVHGYFGHIKTIDAELEEELADCTRNVYGEGGKYDHCWVDIDLEVNAGDILGTVGNNIQTNFDFGVYDERTPLDYANPSRYSGKSLYMTCPLEFFDDETKNDLYNKISRTTDPKCGEVMQDVKGTLQGNWYFKDAASYQHSDWTEHLSFAYDNNEPSEAVISIGGIFTDSAKWVFTPNTSGFINHEFADVTPDGNLYCYESEFTSDKIIVQLVSDAELQIEHQDGSCSGNFEFNNPTIYYR